MHTCSLKKFKITTVYLSQVSILSLFSKEVFTDSVFFSLCIKRLIDVSLVQMEMSQEFSRKEHLQEITTEYINKVSCVEANKLVFILPTNKRDNV